MLLEKRALRVSLPHSGEQARGRKMIEEEASLNKLSSSFGEKGPKLTKTNFRWILILLSHFTLL